VHRVFFADLSKSAAKEAALMMVDEPSGIGTTPVSTKNSVIQSKPTWYIETTEDQVISLESQRKMVARAPWIKTLSIKASHSPMLSKPAELAGQLIAIQSQIK
jgi:pimeloyl-ACP methyl ester carboxylesterase